MRNRNSKSLALVVVASTVLIACNPLNKMVKRQGEVNYELTPNPVEMHGDSIAIALNGSFPEKYFNKKVSVFGIDIYAVPKVEDSKLLHAANIMAQYLDNNEDGIVDNSLVLDKMLENKAFVIMWKSESDRL